MKMPNIQASLRANRRRVASHNRKTLQWIGLASLVALTLTPGIAAAAPWDGMATQILAIFTGGLTRTIAIIAVIAAGIAAVAGKLSWDWVIKIGVGIALIFGSAAIVDYMIAAAG